MFQREKMEDETRQWAQRPEGEKEDGEGLLTDDVICAVEFGEAAPLSTPTVASLSGRTSNTLPGLCCQAGKGAAGAAAPERSSAAGDTAKVTSVGVCIFERVSFKLRFCELYTTSDLSLLEALLLQVRPACVVSSEGGSSSRTSRDGAAAAAAAVSKGWENKLREVSEGTGASYVQLPRRARDTRMLMQDLEGLLRPEDELKKHLAKEMLLSTACAACASLLYYTRLLSDDAYVKQCSLEVYSTDLYLQVDTAAAAALYLFPSLALQRRQQQQLAAGGPLLLAAGSTAIDKDSAPAGAYIKRTSAAAAAASSSSSGVSNVYALLARWTGSSLGARRLFAVLSQPLVDRQEIERRLDIVEIFQTEDAFRREVFTSHFKHVFDLDALAAKLHRIAAVSSLLGEEAEADEKQQEQKGEAAAATARTSSSSSSSKRSTLIARTRLGLEGLVRLYNCILETTSLQKTLAGYTGRHAKTLQEEYGEPLAAAVAAFKPFLELIDFTIDAAEASRGCFVVKREFDAQLAALLDKRTRLQSCMQSERQRVEQLLPFESRKRDAEAVRLTEDATMGFVLRVTKKDQAAVLSHQHGERTAGVSSAAGRLQVLRVNKSEVLFTTGVLKQQCSEYKDLCEAIESKQRAVVEKVLCVAASYWPVVEKLAELLGMLDVLGAFAAAANAAPIPYVRPKFIEEGTAGERGTRLALLENCRHPLVEQQAGTSAFISNDVLFDREEARVHVVTGPNMGGKSTYIRQVALTVVLAQSGCFVPCSRCELIVFKRVLCRVGASDMQLRGVSTFYAEMLEAASVLRHAQRDSLVIIDEIGRGTSTYEGFGLAWAIAKELAEKTACCCLFATHFHEMGLLAAEVKGVINSHVAAAFNPSSKELTFLYKVERGAADQSYGVLVAQYAGLPAAVVRRAAAKARELEAIERGGISKQTAETKEEKEEEEEEEGEKAKEQEETVEGDQGVAALKESLQKSEGDVAASGSNTMKAGAIEKQGDATVSQEASHAVGGEDRFEFIGSHSTTEKVKDTERRVSFEKEKEREFKKRRDEHAESPQRSPEAAENGQSSSRDDNSSDNSNRRSSRDDNSNGSNKHGFTGNDCKAIDKKICNTVAAVIEEVLRREDTKGSGRVSEAERERAWKQMRLLLRDAFSSSDTETVVSKVHRSARALRILGNIVAPELNWSKKSPLRCRVTADDGGDSSSSNGELQTFLAAALNS